MLVRVRKGSRIQELTYDPMEGIEVLQLQITSILDDSDDKPPYFLMDFAGREISSHEDIEDIKVVEINEIETSDHELLAEANRLEGLETTVATNISTDEWAQHIDVSNATILSSSEYESAALARRRASGSNNVIVSTTNATPLRSPSGSFDVVSRTSSSVSLVRANAVANVWVVNSDLVRIGEYCTGELFPNDESILQPCYRLIDSPFRLCARCRKLFDDSIIVSESIEATSFFCEGKRAVDMGLAFPWALETLEMESVLINSTYERDGPANLFLKRALMAEAIGMQPTKSLSGMSEEEKEFSRRLASGCDTVKAYEDPEQQEAARAAIDYEKVGFYASEYLRENGGSTDSNGEAKNEDVAFVTGLLRWFKNDFFKWVNKPGCENPTCEARASRMESIGVQLPTDEERSIGGAGRVEVYRCNECQYITRFPRFNKPSHLLKTRRGRCGEWANAFCLICRSLSLDARWVLDFTDHVWVEVWIPSLRRFVHADPCEKRLDAPLMYEAGWNKKLTHILSFSRYGVVDASPRYSRRLVDVIHRRSAVSEKLMHEMIKSTDAQLEQAFVAGRGDRGGSQSSSSLLNLEALVHGQAGFDELAGSDISLMTMRRRKRLLSRELLAMTLLTGRDTKLEELQGRISGDQAWKESRGEQGSGAVVADENGRAVRVPVAKDFRFPLEVVRRPAWLLPGLLCSSTALKSGYIDIDVSSFDFETCKRYNPPTSSSSSSSSSSLPPPGSEAPGDASATVPRPQSSILSGNVTTSLGARGINAVALCPKTGSLRSSSTFTIELEQQQQQQPSDSATCMVPAPSSEIQPASLSTDDIALQHPSQFDSFLRENLLSTTTTSEAHSISRSLEQTDATSTSVSEAIAHCHSVPTSSTAGGSIVILTALEDGAESGAHAFGTLVHHDAAAVGALCGPSASCSANDHSPSDSSLTPGSWLMVAPPSPTSSAILEEHAVEGFGPSRIRARYNLAEIPACTGIINPGPNNPPNVSIVKLEGDDAALMCAVPSHLILPQEGESQEALVQRAKGFCLSQEGVDSLGFVLCKEGHVVVFGDAGYPLRYSPGAVTFLKTVAADGGSAGEKCDSVTSEPSIADNHSPPSVLPSSPRTSPSPEVVLKYVSLGGGSHGDTIDFDSTQFLWSLIDRVGEALPLTMSWSSLWNLLRVDEISFWAGDSLVNGMQMNFSLSLPSLQSAVPGAENNNVSSSPDGHIGSTASSITLKLKSPTFTSDHDSPRRTVFRMYPDDRVTYIAVRSGHLVDSVFLRTAAGWTFSAGGSGGGNLRTLTIPDGWKFIGFFGGTGGHLHNVGAVLLRDESSIAPRPASISLTSPQTPLAAGSMAFPTLSLRLLQLCEELSLWDCGLNHYQHRMDQRRHALVGRLIDLTSNVIRRNASADCVLCLETCAVYAENIAKNTADKRLRKVKVRNAFLTKNVLCAEGGLELFAFGPAAFRLTADGAAFETCVSLFSEGGDLARDDWVKWLKAYSGFLRAAVAVVKSASGAGSGALN